MKEYPEIILLNEFFRGERNSFNELHKRYFDEFTLFSNKFIKNKPQAEFISNGVLSKLFQFHDRRFDSIAKIEKFLYVATRNASLDYLRYIKRLSENLKLYAFVFQEEQSVSNIDVEWLHHLYQALDGLPSRSGTVIYLLFIKELTYAEVAESMGISIKTVKELRAYGLQLLRRKLKTALQLHYPFWKYLYPFQI